MANTVDIPEPVVSPATDKQVVVGPAGKKYVFSKGISQQRIDKYFTKQGWTKKDGKWLTASGEDPSKLKGTGSGVPTTTSPYGIPGNYRTELTTKLNKLPPATTDFGTAAVPSILGGIGGTLGGPVGAGIGGAAGESIRELARRFDFASITEPPDTKREMYNVGIEAVKQAALDKVGTKAGDIFFNALTKAIPHAVVKKGIPLLPGDLSPNSKLMRYTEDLLSNLAPSSKTMAAFREKQNTAIIKQTEKLAQGFARFNGTSEELGVLLQNTMKTQEDSAYKGLKSLAKSLPKGKTIQSTPEYKDFVNTFKNELAKSIIKTEKPELIAGYLRTQSAGLENTRRMLDLVHETKPDLVGKIQNRVMRDVVSEVMTGSKDPTIKANLALTKGFSGPKFKTILDGIGEEKLKVLYGEKGLKTINDFENVIAHVDKTQGNGAGKFLNLIFILPFRGGTGVKSIGKTASLGFLFNRAAKIITSPDGVKMYENYIRATAQQAPRAAEVARQEIKIFNERSDTEYKLEEQEAEEQFKKSQQQETK